MAETTDTTAEQTRAGGDAKADVLAAAREAFELAEEAERDNRDAAKEDLRFARLSDQWPESIRKQREQDGRPCLTIPRMNAFIRQVVNDARQNKPSIKVHPAASAADIETAEIYNGLIRNIEYTSNADVAYDTSVESAVSGGFGYFRIGLDYTHDDTFDLDITINRVPDPFLIYGDPYSTSADSSDWNSAFVIERLSKARFEAQHSGADPIDWEGDYGDLNGLWYDGDTVTKAEWWTREEVDRPIVKLSDGSIVDAAWLQDVDPDIGAPRYMVLASMGVAPVAERTTKTHKVTQRIMTGAEVLETNEWPGRFIPIVPVYGDEVFVDGKRYFRSLIRDAKDAQRMFNYWRSTSTELVALAPKVPFIGKVGAFKTDAAKWATVNTVSHPYLEYDGNVGPQRQPLDFGPAGGALQEALNASDDMKSIMGLYDASLGARSNETSGKAILARQREGDVSTFHFIDNLSRAIRHAGRIVIDLIPHVYTNDRIVRVIGEDGSQKPVQLGKPQPVTDKEGKEKTDENGKPMMKVYDLSLGKYDLTVTAGPSFTTKREEAAAQMTEMVRAFPAAAPLIGDIIAKNLDWPGADEIAERLRPKDAGGLPPEVQQMIAEGKQRLDDQAKEIEALKADKEIDARKVLIDGYKAETERLRELLPHLPPEALAQLGLQQAVFAMDTPDVAPGGSGGPKMPPMGGMPPRPPQPPPGTPQGAQMMPQQPPPEAAF